MNKKLEFIPELFAHAGLECVFPVVGAEHAKRESVVLVADRSTEDFRGLVLRSVTDELIWGRKFGADIYSVKSAGRLMGDIIEKNIPVVVHQPTKHARLHFNVRARRVRFPKKCWIDVELPLHPDVELILNLLNMHNARKK
jgi:hypothetical protein